MALDDQYTIFRVSKTKGVLASAHQYKTLRLRALKLSPVSFASTYETEATFSDEYWISHITHPGKEIFVCATNAPPESTFADNEGQEWVAQVTFFGPRSIEAFTLPPVSEQPNPGLDEEEERWQMLGLFTLPSHQGKGIAKALCRSGLDHLVSYRSQPEDVRVRLMVKPGMPDVLKMYKNLGFTDAGRMTLAEALFANGDEDHLPEDFETQENFCARTGFNMIKILSRAVHPDKCT